MAAYIPHTAHWSARHRTRLVITSTQGNVTASYTIDPPAEPPGHDMLTRHGWTAYPGAEWTEDPPGEWTCAVYTRAKEGDAAPAGT